MVDDLPLVVVEVGHQGVGVSPQGLVAVGGGRQETKVYLQELVVVGGGHQKVEACLQVMVVGDDHQEVGVYLQELVVKEVDCCLGVEEEVWRSLAFAQERIPLVEEGDLHVSLEIQMLDWVWVLQEVTVEVGPRVMVSCELVEVCWVQEGGNFLNCLVLMKNLDVPWEDLGHCCGN